MSAILSTRLDRTISLAYSSFCHFARIVHGVPAAFPAYLQEDEVMAYFSGSTSIYAGFRRSIVIA